MKAAWYERYGAARDVIQVGEMPKPAPGPGEVLVAVRFCGMNPSDWRTRTGSRGPDMPFPRIVPGQDGAGVIESVGEGVPASRVGERVWLYESQWQRPFGASAEYIALPSNRAVPLADSTSFEEGACIGIPAMTAHRCVFADGPVEGKTVLVTGGAGAVGSYAAQLAKWGGATVIATVSSDEKAAHAVRAGADHIVNYRTEDVVARVRELTNGQGVEHIVDVDFGGNLEISQDVLKVNGVLAMYASGGNAAPSLPYQPFMRNNITFRFVLVYTEPEEAKRQAVADITEANNAGRLWHPIAARFPLEETAAAHEFQESNKAIGNIVIAISSVGPTGA